MPSKHIVGGDRLASTLTGLSVAISIAREAADAVPAVRQTLGSAARILALVEKIEKDREALHALADKALQLAQRVEDLMRGRPPDARMLKSFERINSAFNGIEEFMIKHAGRSRLRRVIGYALTVSLDVDRLSRELADAVQELILVALLDANHEAHQMHRLVAENVRYAGEFRLLKHCDVEKLANVEGEWPGCDIGVKYHRARVDGQLVIVRYFERTEPRHSRVLYQGLYEGIISHDRIVAELSTVQRSHPNVARIYGWSKGSIYERFTVFKSGFCPVTPNIFKLMPNPTLTAIQWIFKLLVEDIGLCMFVYSRLTQGQDAVHHLRRMGVDWEPSNDDCIAINDELEPTIGFRNDLCRITPESNLERQLYGQIFCLIIPIILHTRRRQVGTAEILAAIAHCGADPLPAFLGRFETFIRHRYVFLKADFANARVLADGTAEGLLRTFEEEVFAYEYELDCWKWGHILLALDKSRVHWPRNDLHILYTTGKTWRDSLKVHGMSEDSERVIYDRYVVLIPNSQRDEVREMFGLPAYSEDRYGTSYRIAIGGPGTYRAQGVFTH